ncbi:hypothetical protein [Kluyvera chengduensis]|uniref:hypothetical protein n=1 Tax=Kluyvera sp. 142359 TaxID=3375726 RepID=UPI003772AAC6
MRNNLNEDDFHDNLIHGIVFYSEPGELSSDIALDIDYIYEWVKTDSNEINFVISKALLKFHEVTDLKLSIDWGETNNSFFLWTCIRALYYQYNENQNTFPYCK